MVPDRQKVRTDGMDGRTDRRMDDAKTISLRLRRGIKINTQLAFVYYPNRNEMDQMVRNDIPCNCIPIVRIVFGTHTFDFNCFFKDIPCNCIPIVRIVFGTHTFDFNCFFKDFNCIFTQIRYLSRVLDFASHPAL